MTLPSTETTLLIPVTSSNEHADCPAGALVRWSPALAQRIANLQAIVIANALDSVQADFEDVSFVDFLPDDAEDSVVMAGRYEILSDNDRLVSLPSDDAVTRAIAAQPPFRGLSQAKLVVAQSCWFITSYHIDTGVDYETTGVPIDVRKVRLVELADLVMEAAPC